MARVLSQAANDAPLPAHVRVTDLRADFVPGTRLAIRQWFCASPLWHYHRSGVSLHGGSHFDYQMVDPDLRQLCQTLHQFDIPTAASCEGHFHDREWFEEVWDELQREADMVKTTGLPVRDSHEGRSAVFRNPQYRLPWRNESRFYDQVVRRQSPGSMSFVVPDDRAGLRERLARDEYATSRSRIRFDQPLNRMLQHAAYTITVNGQDERDRRSAWQEIHAYMQDVLNHFGRE